MHSDPDLTWLFIRMMGALVLVSGLAIVLIRFVLPRLKVGRRKISSWGSLVDRRPLDTRNFLYLVKITGRYFVLAGGDHSLTLVTEMSQSEGEKIENT